MNIRLILFAFIFSQINAQIISQSLFDGLNSLPPTLIERAPEFNIEKKYQFSFDSIDNLLLIQEIHRNPRTQKKHFYQYIYEIPLADLSIGSFRVSKNQLDNSKLVIKIGTLKDKASIIFYWLYNYDPIIISTKGKIDLGDWEFTDETQKEFSEALRPLFMQIPNQSVETHIYIKDGASGETKFMSDQVQFPSATVGNKWLNNDYFYNYNILNPAFYDDTKNRSRSEFKLLNDLKNELIRNDISVDNSPVLVHVNKDGSLKSVFLLNLNNEENKRINLSNFSSFSPGNDGDEDLNTKFFIYYMN